MNSTAHLPLGAQPRAGELVLDGCGLTPRGLEALTHAGRLTLCPRALQRVAENRAGLARLMRDPEPIYGVTTGFGALVDAKVQLTQASDLQHALLRSHAAGVGEPLPDDLVRAAMIIRVNSLLRAASGVRPELIRSVVALLNSPLAPVVPRTGSLGASGDLAPSAHAFLPLIGEGLVRDGGGDPEPAGAALARHGLAPIALSAKEGLALINGTHFMAAIGAFAVLTAERLLDAADRVAAVTVEALNGTTAAFDERVGVLRPLPGQGDSARALRDALAGSGRTRPQGAGRAQDAYSLRCVPQIHGAAREGVRFTATLVAADLDAVTDNPLVFDDPDQVLSAGNFHGQSLALALDVLRTALADLGAVSERRTFRLVSPSLNGDLPAFLTRAAGSNSGLMVVQYTAAALVSELRALAHPVSTDSVPTSDSQEDHVSMGMTAALMALETLDRLRYVLAIELLCACQALDLLPGLSSPVVAGIHGAVRREVDELTEDRPPSPDVERLAAVLTRVTGVTA